MCPVRTKSVLDVIKGIFEAGGGTLADVTFETIFLKDLADNAAMSDIYKAYATIEPPARYCIQADLVRPVFLLEISSVAHVVSDPVLWLRESERGHQDAALTVF